MLAFAGQRISPHMVLKKSGELVCIGVPVARCGTQEYRLSEITGEPSDEVVSVLRSPEHVLDATSVASFEGAPICDTHPSMFLTPENWSAFAKGHMQNCRIGRLPSGEQAIFADLVVSDRLLIEKILHGNVRDVSVGYGCQYFPLPDGRFEQRTIRANHVAIVSAGRANADGHPDEVKIMDCALAVEEADDFSAMCARYHRQNPLAVRPAPRVRTHGTREHIEGKKVMDMGKSKSPEELVRAIQNIRDSVKDEASEIVRAADLTTDLMRRGTPPGKFAEKLRQVNASYRNFDDAQRAGEDFAQQAKAAGEKMRDKFCTDLAPVRVHGR